MRIPRLALFSILVLVVSGCQSMAIRKAISRQLEDFPESRVQDIYKSFCQDYLGPEHLIPDPEYARNYLREELSSYRGDLDSARYQVPATRFYPVGDRGNYERVDLSVVLDGLVSEDALLDAFVRSANTGQRVTEDEWVSKWKRIAGVIRERFPSIPDSQRDLARLDSLIAEGHLIFHHSEAFSEAYHPHYRIISKDIFEEDLKDLIPAL